MSKKINFLFLKSAPVKFSILAAGSAVFIGMPCPCCGGNSCAIGLMSAAATGAVVNGSCLFLLTLKKKFKTRH